MVAERDIEKYLCNEIKAHGGIAYKFTSPACRGVPDRLVLTGLKEKPIFFVEVKKKGGILSKLQKAQIEKIRKLYIKAHVIYSIDDVDNLIKATYKKG